MLRLCLIVLAAAGCADSGDEGFVVHGNLASDSQSACSFTADPEGPFVPRGALGTQTLAPYQLSPLIESRISALMGQESMRTVALMGARIDLAIGPITVEDAQGNRTFSCAAEGTGACFTEAERAALATSAVTRFRSLFAVPLAPNGGLSVATFDLIPTAAVREIQRKAGAVPAGARLHGQVVATATLYGQLGGTEVEGLPFVYPVTVCNDCVVNVVGACEDTPAGFTPRPGNPCNRFQDGVVDCCTEVGGGLLCPAVGTMP